MAKSKKDARKPDISSQPNSDSRTDGWMMKAVSDLQESILRIENRLKRVEITVYGVLIVVVVVSVIFSVIIGPSLNTLLKYLLENFELKPK